MIGSSPLGKCEDFQPLAQRYLLSVASSTRSCQPMIFPATSKAGQANPNFFVARRPQAWSLSLVEMMPGNWRGYLVGVLGRDGW